MLPRFVSAISRIYSNIFTVSSLTLLLDRNLLPSPIFVTASKSLCKQFYFSMAAQSEATANISELSTPLQIGLTGSIGMGKSTVDKHLRLIGIPVFDADEVVHHLYRRGGAAVELIQKLYPDVIKEESVCRKELSGKILQNPSVLSEIEKIVHPLVAAKRNEFFEAAKQREELLIVHDIPLLFETNQVGNFDYVMVVSANADTQRRRVLDRPGMTEEKFAAILQKQVPDEEKRRRADFVIRTDFEGFEEAKAQVSQSLESIVLSRQPARWQHWKSRRAAAAPPADCHPLRRMFDAVVFDLDDTLVPVAQQLAAAQAALLEFMDRRMPNSALMAKRAMKDLMAEARQQNPLLAHDLTALRKLALRNLARVYSEEDRVDEAMEVFLRARSDVSAHLYEDVLQCFEWLRSIGVTVGIMTNGNANLSDCSMTPYLSLVLTAGDVGASKPSPIPFFACCQRTGFVAQRILYVGDSYDKDVVGAKAAGMKALFLVRPEHGEHPLQQRKRRLSESESEAEASAVAGDDGAEAEEEGLRNLLSRFPAADMASFDLRPNSILNALRDWERRGES